MEAVKQPEAIGLAICEEHGGEHAAAAGLLDAVHHVVKRVGSNLRLGNIREHATAGSADVSGKLRVTDAVGYARLSRQLAKQLCRYCLQCTQLGHGRLSKGRERLLRGACAFVRLCRPEL